ncbi:MAG TPA: hypothetical protein VJ782_05115 [Aeromicrobium sp.]|nr:hypothetical protein [Aeromicrobium sp.]
MSKTKVRLRFPTVGQKRGDVIEVDKEQAEALIANGSAVSVKDATPKQDAKS